MASYDMICLLRRKVPRAAMGDIVETCVKRPDDLEAALCLLRLKTLKRTHPWIGDRLIDSTLSLRDGDEAAAYQCLNALPHAGLPAYPKGFTPTGMGHYF